MKFKLTYRFNHHETPEEDSIYPTELTFSSHDDDRAIEEQFRAEKFQTWLYEWAVHQIGYRDQLPATLIMRNQEGVSSVELVEVPTTYELRADLVGRLIDHLQLIDFRSLRDQTRVALIMVDQAKLRRILDGEEA